ncbi:uncharacterized protein YALI1_F34557g [Yarrowia lipolytica]|uniref:Uncharacterized protein n=1 Tax=Yarrowia lipolytica TaxID=4952 RepID=A0A1D8NQ62_YARLL|nr:hypothetical protein YALI1_F34557g [Yarrowia lipolytica]
MRGLSPFQLSVTSASIKKMKKTWQGEAVERERTASCICCRRPSNVTCTTCLYVVATRCCVVIGANNQ